MNYQIINLFLHVGSEDKSLAIPAKVQESLLSKSCDPRDVVRQLREQLQVEHDSLEHPGPETKRLIRCLARKAKHSKRLDVVKYLREVTPAGTTGESDRVIFEISLIVVFRKSNSITSRKMRNRFITRSFQIKVQTIH